MGQGAGPIKSTRDPDPLIQRDIHRDAVSAVEAARSGSGLLITTLAILTWGA